jgi:hypothetical protein
MDAASTTLIVSICLLGAVFLGRLARRRLLEHHLSPDTRDTVKLALGLVATMAAILLGLLVSSAKGSYDTQSNQVIQMAAKASMLDRVLSLYGEEAAAARAQFHSTIDDAIRRVWPTTSGDQSNLVPNVRASDSVYVSVEQLAPTNDRQVLLKADARGFLLDIAERRALLVAQAAVSSSSS